MFEKDESVGFTTIDQKSTSNSETPPKTTLSTVFKIISKGNELKKQYGFVIPKLARMLNDGKGI